MKAVLAYVVDSLVGDPDWIPHPTVGMGKLVERLEALLWSAEASPQAQRWRGALAGLVVVALVYALAVAVVEALELLPHVLGVAVEVWLLSTTVALSGLLRTARAVQVHLDECELDEARKRVWHLVSRETEELDEAEVARAALESVAENLSDGAVAPLFYMAVGGLPLAVAYRAVNTLDSMLGYRSERYVDFGWFSARLDDFANYLPARLTGAAMVAAAHLLPGLDGPEALRAVRTFAGKHPSPNAGIPESAAAGGLNVALGGPSVYHGRVEKRPKLGWSDRPVTAEDIGQLISWARLASLLVLLILVTARGLVRFI